MATQYEKNQAARAARESGLCMRCGHEIEDRDTLTKDNKPYANCRACRPNKQMVRPAAPKPKKVQEVDYCFFDQAEFKQLCRFVSRHLPATDTFTIGDIQRAAIAQGIDANTIQRHLADVIWWLEDKHIECVRDITPKRYARLTAPRRTATPSIEYGKHSFIPSRALCQPDNASIYQEAR